MSDAQATAWIEAEAVVWAVVVRPWVLVQPLDRRCQRGGPVSSPRARR
ncbi:MAG: DUF2288 family protein [Halochromatium sp.]